MFLALFGGSVLPLVLCDCLLPEFLGDGPSRFTAEAVTSLTKSIPLEKSLATGLAPFPVCWFLPFGVLLFGADILLFGVTPISIGC